MTSKKNEIKNIISKTIYYLGAGASYGKRDKSTGFILEGIPVVAEISMEFDAFRSIIANTDIPNSYINFWNIYKTKHEDAEMAKQYMLNDIDSIIEGVKEHATIDTYARKLFLTKRIPDFNKLKRLLCIFFMSEQLEHKPDVRYDTFLANILELNTLNLPKNIRQDTNAPTAIQLIQIYANSTSDTSALGFQFDTHLSFVWEESPNNDHMRSSLVSTTFDTEQVVVIGYSFPFFNRETDREIY